MATNLPGGTVRDPATDQNFRSLASQLQELTQRVGTGEGEPGPEGKEGKEGPEGPKGETGATGAAGLTWKGEWSVITAYLAANEAVTWKGSSYRSLKANTGKEPPSAEWELIAEKGAKGETGSKGETGAAGKDATVWEAQNPIYAEVGRLGVDAAAETYLLGSVGAATGMLKGGTSLAVKDKQPLVIYFDPADYEISGKIAKLLLRATVQTNATKPTISFYFDLVPVTNTGAEDVLSLTAGAGVTGSEVEIKEPAASSFGTGATSPFTMPSAGVYMVAVTTSGTLTNNSTVLCSAQLSVVYE